MSITTQTHAAGFPFYTLTHGEDEVVISAFGGQILSWTQRGVPILFENRERAILDGKTPYRGGAPICFSHFGRGTLLPLGTVVNPQHGHARTTIWDSQTNLTDNSVVLTTTQPSPDGYGPTNLRCHLIYTLGESLSVQATTRNTGDAGSPFQWAIHSYWATTQPENAIVSGLGNRYLDNLQGLSEQTESDSSSPHVSPIDRVYLDPNDLLEVRTEIYRLRIATQGGSGAVLWNPGKNHDLKDVGSPDFICVEVGVIDPPKWLAPDEEHSIKIDFKANLI